MAKKITLLDIAKAKFSSKKNLPAWYEKRLNICGGCEWNSDNKPMKDWTMQEKAWVTANLGQPTCLACKCEIAAKDSLPHAVCGLKSIGKEPKWGAIETIAKTGSLEIENISTTPLTINNNKQNEIVLDYGTIKVGQPTDVQLLIKDLKDSMTDISVATSCGCTKSKAEKKGQEVILTIVYDTKRQGDFTKTVVLSYKQNNMDYEKVFKITGKTE